MQGTHLLLGLNRRRAVSAATGDERASESRDLRVEGVFTSDQH